MANKNKIIVHEGDECKMAEAFVELENKMGNRLGSVERNIDDIKSDVDKIKEDQHQILKSHIDFKVAFTEHCSRDDEKMKAINKAIDGISDAVNSIKNLYSGLSDTQKQQEKEMMRIELKSEMDNLRQEKEQLKKEIESKRNGFWGMLQHDSYKWIIRIILGLISAGVVFGIAKIALVNPILEVLVK